MNENKNVDNVDNVEKILGDIFGNTGKGKSNSKEERKQSVSSLFGEEEEVSQLKRNGTVTGVVVRKEVPVDKVTYDEVQVEFANSESSHMYEGILLSRQSGYTIRFRVYNERMVDFERYEVKRLDLKKLLLEAIASAIPELVDGFELNIRACM